MKKGLVIFVLALILGALLYQLVREDSGYLLLAYGHTTLEMSLWTALVLWVLVTAGLFFVAGLIRGSRRLAARLGSHSTSRRAQQRTMEALVDFIEGNWQAARKKLVRQAPKSASPLVNYLAAARSAYELGDIDGALALLHQAERAHDTSPLAVALTQARMQLNSQSDEKCLATLKRIRRLAPDHPVVLELLLQVYLRLNDYDAVEELLPELKRAGIRKGEALGALEITVFSRQLATARKPGHSDSLAREQLDKVWQRMPSRLHKHAELRAVYAEALSYAGAEQEAEPLLRKSLQQTWRSEWVELYGRITGANLAAQLQQLERWQAERDPDPVLLCALGRLCLRNELWGRARDYFRESLSLAPNSEVYAELGRLLQHLGETRAADALYREGLARLSPPLPELPQPKPQAP